MNRTKGFTLIELLIVVALLGALAIALVATVDPFEQLKKGSDTATRNTSSEMYKALIQYYTVRGSFPWTVDVTGMSAAHADMTAASTGYIAQLIGYGELKTNFSQLAGSTLGRIFLTSTADASGNRQNITVCYLPESKSFRHDANAKYTSQGAVTSGCLATDPTGSACYWCVQ